MASTLTVSLGERSYPVYMGSDIVSSPDFVEKVREIVGENSLLIVTESNVKIHAQAIAATLKKGGIRLAGVHSFRPGEEHKTLITVEGICSAAAKGRLDRNSVFMAVGGGVCGDLTGFASAIYMRGTKFIQIPTTTLAMADSSIGGKTGADLPVGKNLVGAFHQPKAVFMDFSLLSTLECHILLAGYAEVIKTAALFDEEFFSFLEKNALALMGGKDLVRTEEALYRSCEWKAKIVAQDEKESSCRALLNYGHTFGHALETLDGYKDMLHGYAVSIGMCCACTLAELMGMQTKEETERLRKLLITFNHPVYVPKRFASRDIIRAMKHDKKATNGKLRFILPCGIGKARIVDDVPEKLLLEALDRNRIQL